MEDKVFELLNKLYSEMQEGFKGVNTKIDKIEGKVSLVEEKVSKLEKDVADLKKDKEEIRTMLVDLNSKDANRYMYYQRRLMNLEET